MMWQGTITLEPGERGGRPCMPILRGGSGARCPDRCMKLLFDQNPSFKLCALLSDIFPDSKPVRDLGLDRSDDRMVRQHAKDKGFCSSHRTRVLRTWLPITVIRPK